MAFMPHREMGRGRFTASIFRNETVQGGRHWELTWGANTKLFSLRSAAFDDMSLLVI